MNTQAHHVSVRPYLIVFGLLALLTGFTVVLSYMGLSMKVAIVLASLISVTKCTLIAVFFMHLRFEGKAIYAVIITALLLVGVLILALIPDLGVAS